LQVFDLDGTLIAENDESLAEQHRLAMMHARGHMHTIEGCPLCADWERRSVGNSPR
jgi:hypothetical protein